MLQELGRMVSMDKSELDHKQVFRLQRLPLRLERVQGHTHAGALANHKCKDTEAALQTDLSGLVPNVPDRVVKNYRKASPSRSTPFEAHTVALESNWRVPESLEKVIPIPRSSPSL